MTQEYMLDLDKLREEITQNIISLFDVIDEQMVPAEEKFIEFRPVTEGYALAYDTLLRVINVEPTDGTKVPIIELLEEIYDNWQDEDFSVERSWDEMRLSIKMITNGFI